MVMIMGVSCPYCERELADYQGLAGHIRFKHPERFEERYGRDPNLPWHPHNRDLSELKERVKRLEERMDAASRVVRTALGIEGLEFLPECGKFSKLKHDEARRLWVCSRCGEKPF
jgi:hypothetical protein